MAWMKTLADFDYKPKPGVTIAYKAGGEYNAPRAAATLAVAAGKAVRLRKTGKGAAGDVEGDGG
jgi:hypothetical protein